MSSKHPTPVVRDGKWVVGLRAWGFGWHYVLGEHSGMSELEATHRAYAKLDELRRSRLAEPKAQLELPSGAPTTFAQAIDELLRRRSVYDSDAGREYVAKTKQIVARDLGTYSLADFQAPLGDDRLIAYLAALQAQGLAARTVRNRLSFVGQVLRLCAEKRWLHGLPAFPRLPRLPPPQYEFQDEQTIRDVRAEVLSHHGNRAVGSTGEPWEIYVCRRRCGISLMFYLGLHPCDAFGDGRPEIGFRGKDIWLDAGSFVRTNTKSAAHVPVEQFDEVPEPLIDDLRELLGLLGRDAFYPSELIAGGPWPHVDRYLAKAQKKLGIPGGRLNTRVLRRSWVRMMRLLGYTLEECSARGGHSDTRMIHEVYSRVPAPLGRVRKSRWTRRPMKGAPTVHAGARVVQFRPREDPA